MRTPLGCVSTISRLVSRKRPKVNRYVLDARSAQLRTRPFGRGLLDACLLGGGTKRIFDALREAFAIAHQLIGVLGDFSTATTTSWMTYCANSVAHRRLCERASSTLSSRSRRVSAVSGAT